MHGQTGVTSYYAPALYILSRQVLVNGRVKALIFVIAGDFSPPSPDPAPPARSTAAKPPPPDPQI